MQHADEKKRVCFEVKIPNAKWILEKAHKEVSVYTPILGVAFGQSWAATFCPFEGRASGRSAIYLFAVNPEPHRVQMANVTFEIVRDEQFYKLKSCPVGGCTFESNVFMGSDNFIPSSQLVDFICEDDTWKFKFILEK